MIGPAKTLCSVGVRASYAVGHLGLYMAWAKQKSVWFPWSLSGLVCFLSPGSRSISSVPFACPDTFGAKIRDPTKLPGCFYTPTYRALLVPVAENYQFSSPSSNCVDRVVRHRLGSPNIPRLAAWRIARGLQAVGVNVVSAKSPAGPLIAPLRYFSRSVLALDERMWPLLFLPGGFFGNHW